jgi:hypothetical protein
VKAEMNMRTEEVRVPNDRHRARDSRSEQKGKIVEGEGMRQSCARADLKKKSWGEAHPGLKAWALCLFGSPVQVGPGTAEPVQPKTKYIEPRTGRTVWFRKFTEPKLDQGSSSGWFRFGPRFRTEPWQAYSYPTSD